MAPDGADEGPERCCPHVGELWLCVGPALIVTSIPAIQID